MYRLRFARFIRVATLLASALLFCAGCSQITASLDPSGSALAAAKRGLAPTASVNLSPGNIPPAEHGGANPRPEPTLAPWPTVSKPVPTWAPARETATTSAVVYAPILMYHNFDNADGLYSIRPEVFKAQLEALKQAGYVGVTMGQIVASLDHGAPLPSHPIAITLDDARASQALAVKILDDEGFPATFFVPSGWHELSQSYVVGLDRQGFEIGAHTVWHANLVRTPEKIAEIGQGKLALEAWLGHPVLGFAYPYGVYTAVDTAELKRLGFSYGLAIRDGVALRATDRYAWPRLLVTNNDPKALLQRIQRLLSQAKAGREKPSPAQMS